MVIVQKVILDLQCAIHSAGTPLYKLIDLWDTRYIKSSKHHSQLVACSNSFSAQYGRNKRSFRFLYRVFVFFDVSEEHTASIFRMTVWFKRMFVTLTTDKVPPSNKSHAMKAYTCSRGIAPLIPKLGAKLRRVVLPSHSGGFTPATEHRYPLVGPDSWSRRLWRDCSLNDENEILRTCIACEVLRACFVVSHVQHLSFVFHRFWTYGRSLAC